MLKLLLYSKLNVESFWIFNDRKNNFKLVLKIKLLEELIELQKMKPAQVVQWKTKDNPKYVQIVMDY